MKKINLIFIVILMIFSVSAQQPRSCVTYFNNPSFEGFWFPWPGIPSPQWSKCGNDLTPDMQPGHFGVDLPASNGRWYLGLCNQPEINWIEAVSQNLNIPFDSGITYSFKIDVANSCCAGGGMIPGPIKLLIYGGSSTCAKDTLLWSSNVISVYETWMTQNVSFKPNRQITSITFTSLNVNYTPENKLNTYMFLDNIRDVLPEKTTISIDLKVIKEPSCFGFSDGELKCTANGKFSPLKLEWNTGSTENSIIGPSDVYSITVTDSTGCVSSAFINLGQPNQLEAYDSVTYSACTSCDAGEVHIITEGGTTPYTYLWSNRDSTSSIIGLPEGNWNFTVTDANLCSVNGSAKTINTHDRTTFIPNAFSPNGDGNNDVFEAYGNIDNWKKFSIQIWNRDGILVFQSEEPNFKWDGKFREQTVLPGVYVYVMYVTHRDTYVENIRKGSVTVLK